MEKTMLPPNKKETKNSKLLLKNILFIIIAVFCGLLVYFGLSKSGGLSVEACRLAGFFIAALILWVSEALPVGATSLLVIVMGPVFHVFKNFGEAASGFTNATPFFIVASFAMSIAVEKSGIARRMALYLISKAGTSTRRILFVVMFGSGIISAIMSNIPSCAVWMSICIPILDKIGAKKGESNFGKTIMIAIPFACFTGGIATPAGSSINIVAISLIKQLTGINITFLQWMAFGMPLFIILTFVAWYILVKVMPSEVDSVGDIEEYKVEHKKLGGWTANEKKTVTIISIMFGLWILGSWVSLLDTVTVAVVGACVMMLPGIKLITWEDVEKSAGWDGVLIVGCVIALGTAATTTGLSQWIVNTTLTGVNALPMWVAIIVLVLFISALHIPVPINPAIVAAITPPLILLATGAGYHPLTYALPAAYAASCSVLLPLDAVPLVTFSKGYYRMFDMFRPGILVCIAWALVSGLLFPLIMPLFGYM